MAAEYASTDSAAATAGAIVIPEERARIDDIAPIRDQLYVFFQNNRAVESTAPLEAAWPEIVHCRSFRKAFEKAVRRSLLSMNGALRLILYMRTDIKPLMEELDFPAAKCPTSFSAEKALDFVGEFYDQGVADIAGPEEESSDESSSSEEEDTLASVAEDPSALIEPLD